MIQREPIYAALFAKLQAIQGIKTCSRKLKHWNDVSSAEQPAIFMAQRRELPATTTGTPTKWQLNVDVYVYVRTAGADATGPVINPILDAVEAIIQPGVEGKQTLGGLVNYCRIEGAIETDEGTLGDQAVAIIPITIHVA